MRIVNILKTINYLLTYLHAHLIEVSNTGISGSCRMIDLKVKDTAFLSKTII